MTSRRLTVLVPATLAVALLPNSTMLLAAIGSKFAPWMATAVPTEPVLGLRLVRVRSPPPVVLRKKVLVSVFRLMA
ncbi:hypothetical protein D3C86_974980 [compost metagenome]